MERLGLPFFFLQFTLFLYRKLRLLFGFLFALILFPFVTHDNPSSLNNDCLRFALYHSTYRPIRWELRVIPPGTASGYALRTLHV